MRINTRLWVRTVAVRLLVAGLAFATASAQELAPQPELPDSPGTVLAKTAAASPQVQGATPESSQQTQPSPAPAQSQPAGAQQPAATTQPSPDTPASGNQKPVGTAAAEKPVTTGVAASNPAGAAIAPAKQRRVRSLVIKIAALAGAGVAIGTVAALSSASPSRPPGSR
jgi:hypothetical protein